MIPPFLAEGFDVKALESDESTLIALDTECIVLWTNPAWARFAVSNGGADVLNRFGAGTSYLLGVSEALRGFYKAAFGNALETGAPFEQDYECSSPEAFRMFHLRALPFEGKGLLLEHSLIDVRPHQQIAFEPHSRAYARANGTILQCSNCRRVRRPLAAAWDWIPSWVRHPPSNVSHGLCSLCLGFYWG